MLIKIVVTFLMLLPFINSLAMAQDQPLSIENKWLRVNVDAKAGTFTITDKPSNRVFVSQGRWTGGAGQEGTIVDVNLPNIGAGRGIKVTRGNGEAEQIILLEDQPFAFLQTTFHNDTDKDLEHSKVKTASVELDLGDASKLKAQGTGGLSAVDKAPGSYCYLAIA